MSGPHTVPVPTPSRTSPALRGLLVAGLLSLVACSPAAVPPGSPAPTGAATSAGGDSAPSASGRAPASPASPTSPASSPTSSPTGSPGPEPAPKARPQLPGGGRTIFPEHRLVGYAGRTGSTALGRLGIGKADDRARELRRRAKPYAADGRKVLPVLEVIATTVQASAGRDGKYRTRMSDREVRRYLDVARRNDALLLLAIQPGRSDFLTEVKAYDRWLAEPDVGVALDPEWAMGKDEVPGRVFGSTTGAELDRVARHLSAITVADDLPEKVMVFHELATYIVTGESRLRQHRGVAQVKSIDGIGSRGAKEATYRAVWKGTPKGVQPGFKLFYEEDVEVGRRLMTPQQVLALRPRPAYVMYE
jgi:hypothetical protein